jgi:GNAT superfamily N-acetyltransferase
VTPLVLGDCLAFLRRTLEITADDVRRMEEGWSYATPSLPAVWSLNQLRLARPYAFGDSAKLADRHQSEMGFRHVVVESLEGAEPPVAEFVADGWHVDREVTMALSGPVERHVDDGEVVELEELDMVRLMRCWDAEERPEISPEEADQLVEFTLREGRAWRELRFGRLDEDGVPVAMAKLRTDGSVSQVEDVYTVPALRGRGFARSLVSHAASVARDRGDVLVFIVADDNDWPKHLYHSIGFRAVGRTWTLHKSEALTRRAS